MIILKLFITFFKIGLFTFGGGYAMIPMIQEEMCKHGWMSVAEFADVLAIAEMTPGPIAVNAATFVGYRAAGIAGGLLATIGVICPSLILGIIVAKFFFKFSEHALLKGLFYGIRPVIVSLVTVALIAVSQTSIFKVQLDSQFISGLFTSPLTHIDFASLFVMIASLLVMLKLKLHPIITLVGSAVTGIILFHFMGI